MNAANFRRLGDAELLAKLVGRIASKRIYKGSLRAVFVNETHERCAAARELVRRSLNEELRGRCVLGQPSAVRDYLKLHFAGQEHESFVVLHLDAQNVLIEAEEMFRGTLTQTSVYPRRVVKAALRNNAESLVFARNYPSEFAVPSFQDQAITRALSRPLTLVDVRIVDHLVVARAATVNVAEMG